MIKAKTSKNIKDKPNLSFSNLIHLNFDNLLNFISVSLFRNLKVNRLILSELTFNSQITSYIEISISSLFFLNTFPANWANLLIIL